MKEYNHSQIQTFNTCLYQWHVTYRRNLRRIVQTTSMDLGSAIHAGLSAHFLGGSYVDGITQWADNVLPSWRKAVGDIPELEDEPGVVDVFSEAAGQIADSVLTAQRICHRTILRIGEQYHPLVDEQGPLVEREWRYPTKHGVFRGKTDLVVREKSTGMVFLMDFKTKEKLMSPPGYDYDVQMALYQQVLRLNNIDTVGSIIYQIRSELPKEPSLNKDGTMSRSTSLVTDWETYEWTLRKHGLRVSDYLDMKEKLADRKFFEEIRTYRSDETLEAIWDNFWKTVRRIKTGRPMITRNISGLVCPRCPINDLCMAELYGQSTDIIMQLYEVR